MKTYEIVVKKDRKYGLEKSPYVMGRIIGILEGSGADVIEQTFRISEGSANDVDNTQAYTCQLEG